MNLSDGSFPQRVRMRLTGQVHAASCRQELSHPVPAKDIRQRILFPAAGNPAPSRSGILLPTDWESCSRPVGNRIPCRLMSGAVPFRVLARPLSVLFLTWLTGQVLVFNRC